MTLVRCVHAHASCCLLATAYPVRGHAHNRYANGLSPSLSAVARLSSCRRPALILGVIERLSGQPIPWGVKSGIKPKLMANQIARNYVKQVSLSLGALPERASGAAVRESTITRPTHVSIEVSGCNANALVSEASATTRAQTD